MENIIEPSADERVVTAWRTIADRNQGQLTGPLPSTVTVERSALRALIEVAERGMAERPDVDRCDRYSADTDTATIEVERLDDGSVEISLNGKESGACWVVTAAEARQIAQGIVAVVR